MQRPGPEVDQIITCMAGFEFCVVNLFSGTIDLHLLKMEPKGQRSINSS